MDNNIQDVSIEEIMQKIKKEAAKRKSIDVNDINNNINYDINHELYSYTSGNKINFPQQRIDFIINDVRVKSQIRTKIPDVLNRFPVNKSKLFQKIILKFHEHLFREQREVNNEILDILQELSAVQLRTTEEINTMQQDILQTKFSELDGNIDILKAKFSELNDNVNITNDNVNRTNQDIFRQIKDHKLNIIDMQRRLMLILEEARKMLPEPFSTQQIDNILKEEDHIFDAMYATFEDKFRGTREDIKNRQKVYLPFVQEAYDKTVGASIIDVGCGRGEWLELLKESGFDAKGIELNKIMINICNELNLSVVEADAIDYLRSLPANSLCVVTGFHIIEHLPFKTLITLFDESFRVLKPGGIVIFETPNPENLIVGACTFYTDPSHIKPLVPATMQFIAEERGFSKVEIKRLHKYSDYYNVSEENKFINENFYNEMDYAVIGVKL
ncbi:MAG: class I SAM-dependent methyltransferase [Candidatus Acididesulfobacter diazotrophicus]|jgi:O-antigen chain-terminating methyltransferase|uniref:Class I SAM-dependent methyltransferase n=1 Tax=Candidatus Acididesulfobacter diazotrophicus TaxID=2597226 RepID=A0A519BK05_9DELT|nr:MAG: class I SAM-dependent methyltransferase [Candidatus Acididesulfobacter diazotrophicus]